MKRRRYFTELKRLDGKTVLITGGNSGIGKETAVALATRGARVIIACRDPEKAEKAVRGIKLQSRSFNVIHMELDLANLRSVREFCKKFLQQEKSLHILVNNAGMPGILDWTDDGFSMCFGVNHLGHFLLTNLLLPRLKECAPSRVITLTCSSYKYQKLDFQDLNYNLLPYFTYCRSKLANIYFSQELARITEGKGVTSYAVHPAIFKESDVLDVATALQQLSESSSSSLLHLSIGLLPHVGLMQTLLTASPKLTSLYVEFQTVLWEPQLNVDHPGTAEPDTSELGLEKLTVKVTQLQTDLNFWISVLRRCPHLTYLHLAGMRLPTGSSHSQLLSTLSESSRCLKVLNFEDMKLCDCLPNILKLLRVCMLEELSLNDCRLLEKCKNPEKSLVELVTALKMPSLRSLSLAQNRLAKNVCMLAELFSGPSKSSLRHLDIRSNFIQPADLMVFAQRLRIHHPPHRLTLDLRKNPGDRDPDAWNTALKRLQSFFFLLVEGWKSTDTMVDHISNM